MADEFDREDAIPEPDTSPTESEKHRARSFGKLLDGAMAGEGPPPALEAEQRMLLDTATTVRAGVRSFELDSGRRDALIDSVLQQAIGGTAPVTEPPGAGGGGDVTSLESRRRSPAWRIAPWLATGIAAAAAIVLLVTRPQPDTRTVEQVVEVPALEEKHLSRPADALIGKIDRRDADRASDRIDIIFADRMAGYRDLQLRGLAHKGAQP